jgi:hypothetical protein
VSIDLRYVLSIIQLDQHWEYAENDIIKLKKILKGLSEPPVSPETYMNLNMYPLFD